MIIDFTKAYAARAAGAENSERYAEEVVCNTTAASERARAPAPARARIGEAMTWAAVYVDSFGRTPRELERADVAYYLRAGMEEAVIIEAVRAAADAPAPSWRYAAAVMRRCMAEGCLTLEAFQRRTQLHAERRAAQPPPRTSAQQYTQREYTREELAKLVEQI